MSTETVALAMGASGPWALALERSAIRWGIADTADKANWLGQLHHESAGFTRFVESMAYRVERLIPVFGAHRISQEQAEVYGRKPGRPANQEAIANIVYGGEWGRRNLGNTQTGDGWKYRGRGAIQLTGRANVERFSLAAYGNLNVLNDPSKLLTPDVGADAAGWFWKDKRISALDTSEATITRVTRIVNGGAHGLQDRITQTRRAESMFKAMVR